MAHVIAGRRSASTTIKARKKRLVANTPIEEPRSLVAQTLVSAASTLVSTLAALSTLTQDTKSAEELAVGVAAGRARKGVLPRKIRHRARGCETQRAAPRIGRKAARIHSCRYCPASGRGSRCRRTGWRVPGPPDASRSPCRSSISPGSGNRTNGRRSTIGPPAAPGRPTRRTEPDMQPPCRAPSESYPVFPASLGKVYHAPRGLFDEEQRSTAPFVLQWNLRDAFVFPTPRRAPQSALTT